MIHTKAKGHWPFGSGEEDFWRVFTIYAYGGHLGHVTQTFVPPIHGGSTWNLASIGPVVLERIFDNGGLVDANGRRTDDWACLYYKLTNEPNGSGKLKKALHGQRIKLQK